MQKRLIKAKEEETQIEKEMKGKFNKFKYYFLKKLTSLKKIYIFYFYKIQIL